LLGAEFTARSRRLASEGRARAKKPAARAARSAGRSELGRALAAAKIDIRRLPKAKPRFIEPMKALLVKELPRGPEWIYEIKFDGVRALAIGDNGTMSLRSRADKDLAAKYTPVVKALEPLQPADVVLDGEVVAVDARGRSAFQLLQSYQTAAGRKPPIFYYVFDILNLDGRDLTGLPLWQRKRIARDVVKALGPVVRFSDSIKAESVRVMKEMQRRGLEGLMAKQIDSEYQPGQRTGAWVKFKWTREQEFVIGGYTEPQGARAYFGAILVGYYQGSKLLYAGKVGTGFDQKTLTSLYEEFQKLRQDKCPFANLPEPEGLTAAQMRRCTWLKPELVCQVRFSEWTRDGHLRQPAYLGLREDKVAREVSREVPQ
jgi:bifunctional non-homologous end joining protein LigD